MNNGFLEENKQLTLQTTRKLGEKHINS